MTLAELAAEKNMSEGFVQNPCRGIVCGMDSQQRLTHLAWIMGRSSNSQNRVYVVEGGVLRTEAADPSKVEDPRLIIYDAMRSHRTQHVVGNGDQTDTIMGLAAQNVSGMVDPRRIFNSALDTRYCEPDPITFTSRITGYQQADNPRVVHLSLLRADPFAKEHWVETAQNSGLKKDDFRKPGMTESQVTDAFNTEIGRLAGLDHKAFPTIRDYHVRLLKPGFGYCLTTYAPGNPKELLPFKGPPFVVPIADSLEKTMALFWEKLEPEWRVSLGGKQITIAGYDFAQPINRFQKVA